MYTLIETAKLKDIDPRALLAAALEQLPNHPAQRLYELQP